MAKFCTDASSITPTTAAITTSLSQEEKGGSCIDSCRQKDHVLVSTLMAEGGGAGWVGAYYSVRPFPFVSTHKSFFEPAAAGTLEWGFEEVRQFCLPMVHDTTATVKEEEEGLEGEEASNDRNKFSDLGQEPSRCFMVQLTVPSGVEDLYPMMFFDADLLKPTHDASVAPFELVYNKKTNKTVPCPFGLVPNVTFASICLTEKEPKQQNSTSNTNTITFFGSRNNSATSSLGQHVVSWKDYQAAVSMSNLFSIGACRIAVDYQYSASSSSSSSAPSTGPTPFPSTPISAPSSLTDEPTIFHIMPVPIPPTAPSSQSTFSPTPTALAPIKDVDLPHRVFGSHDASCFEPCLGVADFVLLLSTGLNSACDYFMSTLFLHCGTFDLSHGLCPRPECARACSNDDWCFFGAGTATMCPISSAASTSYFSNIESQVVQAACVKSYLYNASTSSNHTHSGGRKDAPAFFWSTRLSHSTLLVLGALAVAVQVACMCAMLQFLRGTTTNPCSALWSFLFSSSNSRRGVSGEVSTRGRFTALGNVEMSSGHAFVSDHSPLPGEGSSHTDGGVVTFSPHHEQLHVQDYNVTKDRLNVDSRNRSSGGAAQFSIVSVGDDEEDVDVDIAYEEEEREIRL